VDRPSQDGRSEHALRQYASLLHILRTPSLRTLHINKLCHYVQGPDAAHVISALFPKSRNDLNELHLERSFVRNDTLAFLISTSRRLKSFKYEITLDDAHYYALMMDFGTTTLVAAIRHQKKSLESLTIMPKMAIESRQSRLFSLREGVQDLSSLKYLSCPLGTIAGGEDTIPLSKKLPPSLLNLHAIIRYKCKQDVKALRALKGMATEWSDKTSLPTVVRVTVENHVSPWLRYDWVHLVRSFSLKGVELVVEGGQGMEGRSISRGYGRFFATIPSDDVSSESSGEVSLYSD
jgi:hypothetical protein